MRTALSSILVLAIVAITSSAAAQTARPTPHQLLDQATRPIRDQLTQLNASDAERRDVADVITHGEAVAAELVEAQARGHTDRVREFAHHIELLARWTRARVEAMRVEAQATEAERAALDAESRRLQARAALERAAERRSESPRESVASGAQNGSSPSSSTEPGRTPR